MFDYSKLSEELESLKSKTGFKSINELCGESVEKIEKLSENKANLAIGEIGLDFYHSTDKKELQYEFLDLQIDLVSALN